MWRSYNRYGIDSINESEVLEEKTWVDKIGDRDAVTAQLFPSFVDVVKQMRLEGHNTQMGWRRGRSVCGAQVAWVRDAELVFHPQEHARAT